MNRMLTDEQEQQILERLRNLEYRQDSPPISPIPREQWLETRANDLAGSIHECIAFGFIRDGYHDSIQKWINELQDLWQMIES